MVWEWMNGGAKPLSCLPILQLPSPQCRAVDRYQRHSCGLKHEFTVTKGKLCTGMN
jgi:hypothetical protein